MNRINDIQRVARMLFGQGAPNPYMGLDLRGQLREGWDNFAGRYLPQLPGQQQILFQPLDENDGATWELMDKFYY